MGDAVWVHGDGGPLILLQGGAVPLWRGAGRNPNEAADYDAICRCSDGVTVIERHGREMLVLTDNEWAGCFVTSDLGEVVIAQPMGSDEPIADLVARITAAPPDETLRIRIVDGRLRLLPGADSGTDGIYGFAEAEIPPGEKTCEVWYRKEVQIVALRPTK